MLRVPRRWAIQLSGASATLLENIVVRQCYAYLGGGKLSVASTTLLENIVVRVMSWEVGACFGCGCRLAKPGN